MPNITHLREHITKYEPQRGQIAYPVPFHEFLRRILNNEKPYFKYHYDVKFWMEDLTQAVDTGQTPEKTFFFPPAHFENDALAIHLSLKKMGINTLLIRQEFNPEPDLQIENEEQLEQVEDQQIEPFAYLNLYLEDDFIRNADEDKFPLYFNSNKELLANDKTIKEGIINENKAIFETIIGYLNEVPGDNEELYHVWSNRLLGADYAYLAAKDAVPPWVDNFKFPRFFYRTSILYGNRNWYGDKRDIGSDWLKLEEELKKYEELKRHLKVNKKGR